MGNPSCLNEDQYGLLCEACDKVLLDSSATVETVAIAWLHVVREHPIFLDAYLDLFGTKNKWEKIAGQYRSALNRQVTWLKQIIKALLSGGRSWFGGQTLPAQADILFISHLVTPAHAGKEEDFYYGALPYEMVQCNRTAVVALVNHTTNHSSYYSDKWTNCVIPRVILSNSLALGEEADLLRRLKNESKRLKVKAEKARLPFEKLVLERAALEAVTGGTQAILRLASQIGQLAVQLKPKAIIITYEGHGWERMVFAAARLAVPGIRCIGYQHAALFRLQHAIRRNLAAKYNPDHIMTAGPGGKAELEHLSKAENISVSVLGSNRGLGMSAMLDEETINTKKMFPSVDGSCLVLPEGTESECNLLFEFSIDCALSAPNILFIWRLHPIVSFKSLASKNVRLRQLPDNISISHETFENDISRCGFALYRGTTAIVRAVFGGLRPVYLQQKDEMTIDPLYRMNKVRAKVSTITEFLDIVNDDKKEFFCKEDKISAIQCCADLFVPFDPEILRNALDV